MAKKTSQLVCQHLENVSRKMLEEYQAVIRSFVRGQNGVYALYRRNKLYYVGLAKSLSGRLRSHLRRPRGQAWDRFSVYLTLGTQYMKEIESVLIRISDPPGNKQRGRFVKSENLLPKVKAEYRRRRKEEEEELFGIRRKRTTPARRPRRKAKNVPGRVPALAKYIDRAMWLRARHKGKLVRAHVRRDGRIRFGGTLYYSPSAAAAVAVDRRARNGWTFWTYERAPGHWVPLAELRK